MNIKIKFFDYWHLSSGVSAGAEFDSLVVKDEFSLPYVPGKTIKGLVREMAENINKEKTNELFGFEGNGMAKIYFSNLTLKKDVHEYLANDDELKNYLYSKITSTKIDEKGLAQKDTLREIEVVIPLELYGKIQCEDEKDYELIQRSISMIKQIGLARNRGLGRCQISKVEK